MSKLSFAEVRRLFKYDQKGFLVRRVNHGPFGRNGKVGDIIVGAERPDGYYVVSVNGERFLYHRLIFFWHKGYWPKYIDHMNRIKSDNRIQNLRDCHAFENSRNTKINSRNKSGHAGVFYRKEFGKWLAFLSYGGRYRHLYWGGSKLEAVNARKRAEKEFDDWNF